MSTENGGMPSIAEVAAQFAGKSMMAPQLTKEGAVAPSAEAPAEPVAEAAPVAEEAPTATPEAAVPAVPSENANPADAKPVDAAPVEEEKKDPASARFAALSRREKELRQKEAQTQQQLKAQEDRLKQMEQELQQRLKEIEDRDTALKSAKRPTDLLKARGWSYQDVLQDQLGNYKPAEPDPVDEKLKPVQEKLSKIDQLEQKLSQWEQQLQQREQEQNLSTVMSTIKSTVSSNAEKYEYLNQMGEQAIDLVKDVMVESYNSGQVLTYEEACDRVEEYYEEEVVKKLLNAKKVQSRLGTKTAQPQQTPPKSASAPQSTPKTLTNAMAASGEATIDIDKLPKREALARLAKQLKFVD